MSKALRLEDIEEFEAMRRIPPHAVSPEIIRGIRNLNERTEIEPFLCSILADFDDTAHTSTEIADILTTKVTYYGRTLFTAFVNKGKASPKVKAKEVSHQLLRLRSIPGLNLIVLLATGEIQDDAKRNLAQVAADANADFIIADAGDVARLFIAHGKVCPTDGVAYISGSCPKCGRDEAQPIELIWNVKEEPSYTVLKHEDISHALAKRFSVRIITDPHYSKPVIRQVIKKAIWDIRQSTYCRSKIVEAHFTDRPPDTILLFLFVDQEASNHNNWICRAIWSNPELDEKYRENSFTKGDERIGDIKIDWNPSYHAVKQFVSERRIPKEDFIRLIESLLPGIDRLIALAQKRLDAYDSGRISEKNLDAEMSELEKEAWGINSQYENHGWPPLECAQADDSFNCYVTSFHNIFLPFAYWFRGNRDWQNRLSLVRMALKDVEKDRKYFEFEWSKIRR